MKRVLLTGGTGFVGANLARRLLSDGHEVHLLLHSERNTWRIESIRNLICLHRLSLQDLDAVKRVVGHIRPEWVFHLAAHGAYSWQTDLREMVSANVSGTMNLVEACLQTGFECFVNTGSSSEYGFKDHPPPETEWLDPNSYYAVTKASATMFCRYVAQKEGAQIPTLRLYSVYGAYEDPNRLMPALIINGLKGKLPPLVNPDIARDFVHVDDVVDAYLRAASTPVEDCGAVYNVGSGTQTRLRELIEVARRVLSIKAEPQWGSMPNRQWDASVWVADNSKIIKAIGWRPRHNGVEDGFRQMVKWFMDNPSVLEVYNKAAREMSA